MSDDAELLQRIRAGADGALRGIQTGKPILPASATWFAAAPVVASCPALATFLPADLKSAYASEWNFFGALKMKSVVGGGSEADLFRERGGRFSDGGEPLRLRWLA